MCNELYNYQVVIRAVRCVC